MLLVRPPHQPIPANLLPHHLPHRLRQPLIHMSRNLHIADTPQLRQRLQHKLVPLGDLDLGPRLERLLPQILNGEEDRGHEDEVAGLDMDAQLAQGVGVAEAVDGTLEPAAHAPERVRPVQLLAHHDVALPDASQHRRRHPPQVVAQPHRPHPVPRQLESEHVFPVQHVRRLVPEPPAGAEDVARVLQLWWSLRQAQAETAVRAAHGAVVGSDCLRADLNGLAVGEEVSEDFHAQFGRQVEELQCWW